VPAYRGFVRTDGAGYDAGTFADPLRRMYEHLVDGSVSAARFREA
jgi:hypothetical protein